MLGKFRDRQIWLRWLAVLLWLAVVAHFSAQPFSRQDLKPFLERQEWLLRAVAALPEMEIRYPGKVYNSRREPVLFVQLVFRKIVHVVLYGTGGLLFLGALGASGLRGARGWAAAVVMVAAAGAYDECRQAGAEGRSGLPQDVALDLAGFLLFYAVAAVLKRKKAR